MLFFVYWGLGFGVICILHCHFYLPCTYPPSPQFYNSNSKRMVSSSENETQNEGTYRKYFEDLMRKNSDLFDATNLFMEQHVEQKMHFQAETDLLRNALKTEMKATLSGLGYGVLAFCSIRYAPTYLTRVIGGPQRARQLQLAEEKSKKTRQGRIRNGFTLIFETLFSLMVGRKCYDITVKEDGEIYDKIVKIPLVQGRSIISDKLCPEWIDRSYNQIPKKFWDNVSNQLIEDELSDSSFIDSLQKSKTVSDPKTWNTIALFAENCKRREVFLQTMKNESDFVSQSGEKTSKEDRFIPSPGVSENLDVPSLIQRKK